MNDENLYQKKVVPNEALILPYQNGHQRSGLQFARRIRLPRAVGPGGMSFPITSVLVPQPITGGQWLLLMGWASVWPHLVWRLTSKAIDPLHDEYTNLKADAILVGIWMGIMGINLLLSAALLMIICINPIDAGGTRVFIVGAVLMVVSCLMTLQLTDIPVAFNSTQLSMPLSLPVLAVYPLLFAWVSRQILIRLAEHKRRLWVMSTRDRIIGVYNRRHWGLLLRNEFDNCRRHQRDATFLIIDIDHFKSINDTWGHDVRDQAIVVLTRQSQTTLRGSDVIGRFGGDEFAVIMCGMSANSAIAVMSCVHEWLTQLRLSCASQVDLRISVDVVPLTSETEHCREQLKLADMALYKTKNPRCNRTEAAA